MATPVVPPRNRNATLLPAALGAVASLVVVFAGTLLAEHQFDNQKMTGSEDNWNLLVWVLYPFGFTGWIFDEEPNGYDATAMSFSPWVLLLGAAMMAVVVFGLTHLVLRSLEVGRSLVAVLLATWFGVIAGGAAGGAVVGLTRLGEIDHNDEYVNVTVQLVMRTWTYGGVLWGFTVGLLVALLVVLVWAVQGRGTAPAFPSTAPMTPGHASPGPVPPGSRADRLDSNAPDTEVDRGGDDSSYPSSR